MKCKEVERLLIERGGRLSGGAQESELSRHLEKCPNCASSAAHIARLRADVHELTVPEPSDALIARTVQACRTQLFAPALKSKSLTRETVPLQISPMIWGALIVLLALTAVVITPIVASTILEREISYPIGILAVIILQNVGMLLFAPILLRNRPYSLRCAGSHWKHDYRTMS